MSKNKKIMLMAGVAVIVLGGVAISNVPFMGDQVAYAEKADSGHAGSGKGGAGGSASGHKGQGGAGSSKGKSGHSASDILSDDGEDSDRPDWAGTQGRDGKPGRGNTNPGISKGGLYGDMYAILRDANGVPVLTAEGFVQPVDVNGNPIPLDEEGKPVDEGATIEVELERLNVGRSPSGVLSKRLEEAVKVIDSASAITLDESGRILLTVDGEEKTIDSPLENLALYVQLINEGTLGLSLDNATLGSLAYLNDGTLTSADLTAAASFFAAASGKYTPITIDSVAYMNTILKVDGTIDQNGTEYVDFSSFSYDRSDVYDGVMVNVLVEVSPGTFETKSVDLYDAVFSGQDYSSNSGIDGYAQAADDARAVIAYVHDNEAR
jgi:hypothetical protein